MRKFLLFCDILLIFLLTSCYFFEKEIDVAQQILIETTVLDITTESEEMLKPTCDYILNTNPKKFHYPNCYAVKRIKDVNHEEFYGTREDVIKQGYDACGICIP